MKRLFTVFFLCLGIGMVGAQNWTHNAGGGLSVPYVSLNTSDDGTKSAVMPGVNFRYVLDHAGGFCFTAGLDAGMPLSKDFVLEDGDSMAHGFGLGLSLGAGWSFFLNDKITLTLLGSVSFDWMRFAFKKDITAKTSTSSYCAEWTQTDNVLVFGIGPEIFASYALGENLSLFADCAVRYLDAGRYWKEGKNVNYSYDGYTEIRGNCLISPSFGVLWTF